MSDGSNHSLEDRFVFCGGYNSNMPYFAKKKKMNHFIRAFQYSLAGLKSCYQNEIAFRQEVWLLAVATPCAFVVGNNYGEIIALIASILLVLIVELLNSAIENILDKTVEGYSNRAKWAKDQGSAAVMLSLIIAGMVWGALIIDNLVVS